MGIILSTINDAQQLVASPEGEAYNVYTKNPLQQLCDTNTVTDIDGNVYNTIKIGIQTWMAENLKTTKYRDGSPIPNVTGNSTWNSSKVGAYCWYDNDITFKTPYGALYNWSTISTGNICPTGWHVPSDSEWNEITAYLGGMQVAGGKMKSTGNDYWTPINIGATNETGFSGLPSGQRNEDGTFFGIGNYCTMWVSTNACARTLDEGTDLNGGCGSIQEGHSIRCTKDFNIPSKPYITTAPITNLSQNSVNTGVIINYDGGNLISLRGLCWDTIQNPDTTKNRTIDKSGTNSFTVNLFNLTPNTTYYVRAYAVNSVGISYGNELIFRTMPKIIYGSNTNLNGFVSDIDGNNYKTVKIGSQSWMAENLKTAKLNDGTKIPQVTEFNEWISMYSPAYCWYNNDSTNKKLYGALYNYYPVETGKLCPTGWHMPNDDEWIILKSFLGDSAVGGKLKEAGLVHWPFPNKGATNSSGFTALPGRGRSDYGGFVANDEGAWWSNTPLQYWYVTSESENLFKYGISHRGGVSVRCLNDTSNIIVQVPELTTDTIILISKYSATSGGAIGFGGGSPISAKGICWSTSPNPDTTNSRTMDGYGVGGFISNITGLIPKTTYYVRAYAINSTGIGYGNELSFTTLPDIIYGSVTDVEGNLYKTVQIGSQIWMAENLKTTKYKDGCLIPNITENSAWSNIKTGAYCWYNNDPVNKNIYGALYNGYTVNTQKLCPDEWHIPTDGDWNKLENSLDSNAAGAMLKEAGTFHWASPNSGANNLSGFTALPGGIRFDSDGSFNNIYYSGYWWSTQEEGSIGLLFCRDLQYDNSIINHSDDKINSGRSIRCVSDMEDSTENGNLQKGLVAYYPFNGNANDESGHNHNGIVNGATLTTDRFGIQNRAYSFNGLGNSISVDGFNLPSNATTIVCWVKPVKADGIRNFISKHDDSGNVELLVRSINNKYQIEWTIGDTYFVLTDNNGYFIIDPNNPRFDLLALIYDGQQVRFYINNIVVASKNITGQIANNNVPMVFGRYAGNYTGILEYYKGILDDIRIYNRVLKDSELQALYTENNISVTTPDLSIFRKTSFEIPVNVNNFIVGDNIISYQFDFNYNPEKIQYQNFSIDGTLSSEGSVQVNPLGNKLSVAWAGQTPLSGSGILLKLRFKALEAGTTTPNLSKLLINTDTIKNITNGNITINPAYGDVDDNGSLQAFDAALALQYSVGLDPMPDIDPLPWEDWRIATANVDGQESISAFDASLILQYTVGLINSFPVQGHKKSTNEPQADILVTAEDGNVVFSVTGDLYGLNITVEGNPDFFGTPQLFNTKILLATNISSSVYSIGMAIITSPAENEIILKIPITKTPVQPIIIHMRINNSVKQVNLGLPTGFTEPSHKSIEMYPNPANTILYFKNLVGEASISIYDMQGRTVISRTINESRIDIGNLDNGIYAVRIENGENTIIRKLIKH